MGFSNFIKKHKIIIGAILFPLVLLILCQIVVLSFKTYFSCTREKDIGPTEAIQIAQKKFGYEKILWIDNVSPYSAITPREDKDAFHKLRGIWNYYVIGEKDGKEYYCIIPSRSEFDDSFSTSWNFDYSFTEIVEKLNEYGADYDLYEPDYSDRKSFIEIENISETSDFFSKNFANELTYEQLDVKASISYAWYDGEKWHQCEIVQSNGELRVSKTSWLK